MKLSIPKLKEILKRNRCAIDDETSDKAQYLDWILSSPEEDDDVDSNDKQHNNNSNGNNDNSRGSNDNQKKKKTVTNRSKKKKNDKVGNDEDYYSESTSSTNNRINTRGPKRIASVQKQTEEDQIESIERQKEAMLDPTLLTKKKFVDIDELHSSTKRAITNTQMLGNKQATLTDIQAKTFGPILEGKDVLGHARTGTGKTLAFLVPIVERILKQQEQQQQQQQQGTWRNKNINNIECIVISPTRELATQIADEAEKLLLYHNDMTVQVMYGGTKKGRDISLLSRQIPTILVATPGRLLDHIVERTKINGRKFGDDILKETKIVVLDETDRLLSMGFRNDIRKVLSHVPRPDKRQTLLFSATMPKELKSIMSDCMKPNYVKVDCVT